MRILLSIAVLLLAMSPALAQFWSHYANDRFGYELDIPPDFSGYGESDNGDGQVFYRLDREQELTVWGGNLPGTFDTDVAERQASDSAANWAISYQTSTPQWAVWSGQRDHRIFYQRMIVLCDGASVAAYRLEYNIRDLAETDAVIDGLNRSFVADTC
jgi:hypothetical protein